jgi:hypothetical protein
MTGKIEDILFSSDAAQSLLMERRVADAIRAHRWEADTGIYYKDEDTQKLREMDVFGIQTFDKPSKIKEAGAPIINLDLNCECKSLPGVNVLFLPDNARDMFGLEGEPFWLGREPEIVIANITERARITEHDKIKQLYDYITSRAFPNGERAINADVSMSPPPVDVTAWSFRETRGGKQTDEQLSERSQTTPVWNAIRAALDASQAARRKARETSIDWVSGPDLKFFKTADFARSTAFFLDSELFRTAFFHSFVVLDARLWRADSNSLTEINSARLYVSTIDHENNYVDVINSSFIQQYINSMVNHYEKASRRSISKQWKLIKEIGWWPGQAEKKLLEILRLKPKKRAVRSRKI